MQKERIELIDIADDLLIINKKTVDTLMQLDNCADCIALYVFYYKTAKWQKTNQIKANDEYVKKSLKWGREKIMRTKNALKEHGLIDIVQTREDGKIAGWYIKVSYLVQKRKIEDCSIIVDSNKSQNQQVVKPTSTDEDINALKEKIKCLKKEIEMLKNTEEDLPIEEASVTEILEYLNMQAGRNFRTNNKQHRQLVKARLKEKYCVGDLKSVIDKKCSEWKGTEWAKYLQPSTLFGGNFDRYLNQPVSKSNLEKQFDIIDNWANSWEESDDDSRV